MKKSRLTGKSFPLEALASVLISPSKAVGLKSMSARHSSRCAGGHRKPMNTMDREQNIALWMSFTAEEH